MKGTFLMHCVILKDESWREQKDPYEAVRSCIEMELESEQCVFVRSRGCVLTISGGRELPECISVKCEFVGTSSAPSDEITGY